MKRVIYNEKRRAEMGEKPDSLQIGRRIGVDSRKIVDSAMA